MMKTEHGQGWGMEVPCTLPVLEPDMLVSELEWLLTLLVWHSRFKALNLQHTWLLVWV